MPSYVKSLALPFVASLLLAACGGGGGPVLPTEPLPSKVGGTVAGLAAGRSLAIVNNGTNLTRVVANGEFSFSSPVVGAYSVTIDAQPLWQNCGVADGNGDAKADVNNVSITCSHLQAVVSKFAGSGTSGSSDGEGTSASFAGPQGLAIGSDGAVFVADVRNHTIRKIMADGTVSTLAGRPGVSGAIDASDGSATFNSPTGVAVNSSGDVFVVEFGGHKVRRITAAGAVTTFAGTGVAGSDDGPGVSASFSNPYGIAIDTNDNVYVADWGNNLIRKITPAGVVSTLAGSGVPGAADGNGTAASFQRPQALAVDASGNVFVADTSNNKIRKITPDGETTTFAESTADSQFNSPSGISLDSDGYVYVADYGNNVIKRISPSGALSILAGSGAGTTIDGAGESAGFARPLGISVDSAGVVYVGELFGEVIRKITPTP